MSNQGDYKSPFAEQFESDIRALIRDEIHRMNSAPVCTCLGEVLAEDKSCPVHGAYLRGESQDMHGSQWR